MNSTRLPSTTKLTKVLGWHDSTRLVEGDFLRHFATGAPCSGDDSRVVRLQAVCELGATQHRDLSTYRHFRAGVPASVASAGCASSNLCGLSWGACRNYRTGAYLLPKQARATRRVWGARWSGDEQLDLILVGPAVRARFASTISTTTNDSAKRLISTLAAPTQGFADINHRQGLFSNQSAESSSKSACSRSQKAGVAAGIAGSTGNTRQKEADSGEQSPRGADRVRTSVSGVSASTRSMFGPVATNLSTHVVTCTGTFIGGHGFLSARLRHSTTDHTPQQSQHGAAPRPTLHPSRRGAASSLFFLEHTSGYTEYTLSVIQFSFKYRYLQANCTQSNTASGYTPNTQNTCKTHFHPLYVRLKPYSQTIGTQSADLDLRSLSPLRGEREILREKKTDALFWESAVFCQGMT